MLSISVSTYEGENQEVYGLYDFKRLKPFQTFEP